MLKHFANTGVLKRFILRRDRIRLLVWIFGISMFAILVAALVPELYMAGTDKMVLAETMKNPAITFMLGYSAGLDNYTDGAVMGHFMLVFTAIFIAIMSILFVTRHTREDEEEGRTEMINSLQVGRLSFITSSYVLLVITHIITSLIIAFGIYALDYETMNLEGSLLFGAAIGAVGVFYASLTVLFAQLVSNSRATLGLSFAFLIIEYIVRGAGDVSDSASSLISPLGLIVRTEVYVNNNWWPILVLIGISLLIFIIALYLNSIRDLGAGFLPTRQGRKNASGFLRSPFGLALRLQKTTIISWIVGMIVLGIAYGSLLGDLEGFLNNSELIMQIIPEAEGMNLTERFITMLITIVSVIGTIPVAMFVLKLSSEEKKKRSEPLLTSPTSRNNLIYSYIVIGLLGGIVIQLASVIGLWSGAVFVMEDVIAFEVLFQALFANIPAMWIFVGVVAFLIGWFPRLTGLTWGLLAYSFFVEYMGEMLKLPEWMNKISPFYHIPSIPAEKLEASTLLMITCIAFLLIGLGSVGYNRRDIEG